MTFYCVKCKKEVPENECEKTHGDKDHPIESKKQGNKLRHKMRLGNNVFCRGIIIGGKK